MDESLERKCRAAFFWTIIKSVIFVACLGSLTYQTAAFYRIYITYPTAISTEVVTNEPFTLPAVTFCYKHTVSRTTFCSTFPHLCEKPKDLNRFCHRQPHFCQGDVVNLTIPMFGYFANYSKEASAKAQEYLFNDTKDIPLYLNKDNIKITFVEDEHEGVFAKCFSERLHLFDGEPSLDQVNIDLSLFSDSLIGLYKLRLPEPESIFPWEENRAFFSIHSPFVPINPLREGISIRPGYHYFAQVDLSKDHLLPYPYKTDCVNYNISWMRNNKTGPRSQDACKETCRSTFLKNCFGCDPGRIMILDPNNLCTPGNKMRQPYYFWRQYTRMQEKVDVEGIPRYLNVCLPYVEAHKRCHDGCKPDCVKLYYDYNIVESLQDPSPLNPQTDIENEAEIQIYVKNPEIMVLSHKPLYTNGDLYSYVGGLMGLWLGISVWTFAGIAQKSCRRSLALKRKLSTHKEYDVKC